MPAVPLAFNHAMVYVRSVPASLRFYADLLGLELLETYDVPHVGPVYARLKAPGNDATIALHAVERGAAAPSPGAIRLYFEVRNLEACCRRLEKRGAVFTKPPALMPWGWKHAYLDDPDGHEVSLYWAGAKRLKAANRKKGK